MKLWGTRLSPYLMRALFCAKIKGVEIAVEDPPYDTHSAEFKRLCPLGKVPVLIDADLVLPESMAICCYINDRITGASIWPDCIEMRARAQLLCQIVDLYLFPEMANVFFPDLAPGPFLGAQERLLASLTAFEFYLRPGERWLAGDRPTVADASMMTTLFYFDYFGESHDTRAWVSNCPLLEAWWNRAKTDPFSRPIYDQQMTAYAMRAESATEGKNVVGREAALDA